MASAAYLGSPFTTLVVSVGLLVGTASSALGEVVRIEIQSRTLAANGEPFGAAGSYEILHGRAFGEIEPEDPRNVIIQDITLAPRNARGRVEYVATFSLARPVDGARASGVLVYQVVNRGNGTVAPHLEGHISLVSGWQGDVVPTATNQTIVVPVSRHADGSSITGPVIARLSDLEPGSTTVPIRLGSMGSQVLTYLPADITEPAATLTSRRAESPTGVATDLVTIPRQDWAFADCRTTDFPGRPDPTRLCLRGGFRADRLYELLYTAKDPLVLGLGLAATRDIVSFFRYAATDEVGTDNPVGDLVQHVVSIGNSQSGNFIKTFIHLGFNQDEAGRVVWDGAFPRIAGRQTPINFRFALPGGAARLYEPGSEGVVWWSPYADTARNRPAASLLDRCRTTGTCPKIVEAFGSAEFWGLRMSPGLVGTDATADIPLPPNVRRYYYPGTTHGGGRGGFNLLGGRGGTRCVLSGNPNPQSDTTRALTAALVDWVVNDAAPPPSRYPLLARGELVPPTTAALRYPVFQGIPFRDALENPMLDYDFGSEFVANDLSGVITRLPPRILQVIPTLVPAVDADGNETSGVESVLHQAPLGTYLGWNITASGFFAGESCGFNGGYVPFARTRNEREVAGDPRPSIEERYGTLDGYICVVRRATADAVRDRFLLPDDAKRLLAEAAQSDAFSPDVNPANRARAEEICGATPRSIGTWR